MKPTQHDTKVPSATFGLFAMLGGPLHARGTGASSPGVVARALAPFVAFLAILSLCASPALAAGEPSGEHIFSKSFGEACVANPPLEPCEGKFDEPEGIAVNEGEGPQAGDVYVVDKGNKRVEVFSATGAYLFEFNGSGSDVAVEGKPAGSDGLPNEEATGRFHEPRDIAIDNDPHSPSYEDVYVLDNTTQGVTFGGVVDKFSLSGAYLGQITEEEHGARFNLHEAFHGTPLSGVAVGSDGEVRISGEHEDFYEEVPHHSNGPQGFIYSYTDEEPNRFIAQHDTFAQTSGDDSTNFPYIGFTVDSNGNSYVVHGEGNEGERVQKLSSEWKTITGEFGGEEHVTGLFAEFSSNDVYIDDGSTVDRFGEEGSLIESLGSGRLQHGTGVAESEQSGEVYVADATADDVEVYAVNTAPKAPTISEEQATHVEATAATLQAKVDPFRAETSYHFEYDTREYREGEAAHGTSTPEVSVGSGERPVPVSVHLTGLTPGVTYYYRAVATNAQALAGVDGPNKALSTPVVPASVACPNEGLRADQPYGLGLPDCRAYEMVSPLDKNGEDVESADARASVANGGAGEGEPAIAYLSIGSFSAPKGAEEANRYISRRGPDGWSTQNVSPPTVPQAQQTAPFQQLLFTPELSQGVLTARYVPLLEDEPAGYVNLYVADFADGSYQIATPVIPEGVNPYTQTEGEDDSPLVEGASTDLSHVVFRQGANLTGQGGGIFEWVGGKLSFVGGGVVGVPGTFAGSSNGWWHAVSESGRRVFFSAEVVGGIQLYVRENPEQQQSHLNSRGECTEPAGACTVEVSASQRTYPGSKTPDPDPNASRAPSAWYQDASADGERVFFTSRVELTSDADTGADDDAANLYEYNLETKKLTDLSVPTEAEQTNGEDPDGAAVVGLVNAAQNAGEGNSYVYFVANGVLAAGAKSGNCPVEAVEEHQGEPTCNLYVEHYGGGKWESPKFIATLAGNKNGRETAGDNDEGDWLGLEETEDQPTYGPAYHTARVTPDGSALAFVSERSLTGYDTEQAQPGDCEGQTKEAGVGTGRCHEVYLYDAVTGRLVCASCDPSGARPVGASTLGSRETQAFSNPSPLYLARNLSEDGARLFFQSRDALVPHASDGKLNVYEWEAQGEGSCRQAGGCTLAISDVTGAYDSEFLDATPNGENVFIATQDQLVPSDTDTLEDVYDVRVDGGFPAAPAAPVCSNADSCKPPVLPQPGVFAAPGSATFSGPGNPTPAITPPPPPKVVTKTVKCKSGFVKKKVKKKQECVKKNKSKKSTHKSAKGRK